MENEFQEFAEEYSLRERVRFAVRGLVIGAAFILLWKLWLLPVFSTFAGSAHCHSVFGVRGSDVLWYGLYVGFPLFLALAFVSTEGRYGLKILRGGQSPPIGFKVLRPTRIKRGSAARRIGYVRLFAFTPFVALAIWGYSHAAALSKMSQAKHPACTANYWFKRSADVGLR